MKLRSLMINLDIFGLQIDLTPFRWARPALKTTENRLLGKYRTHLFLGPLHVWTFSRDGLSIGVSANLRGTTHGTYRPIGENTLKLLWKKLWKS